jgi:hypothetical protein
MTDYAMLIGVCIAILLVLTLIIGGLVWCSIRYFKPDPKMILNGNTSTPEGGADGAGYDDGTGTVNKGP